MDEDHVPPFALDGPGSVPLGIELTFGGLVTDIYPPNTLRIRSSDGAITWVVAEDLELISQGMSVCITGACRKPSDEGPEIPDYFVGATTIDIQSEDPLDHPVALEPPPADTWFTPDNLSTVQATNQYELVGELKDRALQAGFKLCCLKSRKTGWNLLYCDRHDQEHCHFYLKVNLCGAGTAKQRCHVTNFASITHSHVIDPIAFAHKLLSRSMLSLVIDLRGSAGCTPAQIASLLKKRHKIALSSYQVREILRQDRSMETETVELEAYLNTHRGAVMFQEHVEGDLTVRTAAATFDEMELENLRLYGDVISIDPTFMQSSLEWAVIPLTVVGRNREIHSGGIVFTSSCTADVFVWILSLIMERLPCRKIVKTIISDDDPGLDGAFGNPKFKPLDRIICFWHKLMKFLELVRRSGLDEDVRAQLIGDFKRLGCSRDENEASECLERLMGTPPGEIHTFIERSVIPKLNKISKSGTKTVFSLGYISSSISESANSRLKVLTTGTNMTLLRMRKMASRQEQQALLNRRWLKLRKTRKARDPFVVNMLGAGFEIRIAEALAGSWAKSEHLQCSEVAEKGFYGFEVSDSSGPGGYVSIFRVPKKGNCSCGKAVTCGLPCSHQLAVMRLTGTQPDWVELVKPRWRGGEVDARDVREFLAVAPPSVPESGPDMSQPTTSRHRFSTIVAKCQGIATIAAKDKESYIKLMGLLSDFENALRKTRGRMGSKIVDIAGAGHPGRKRKARIIPSQAPPKAILCYICGGHHKVRACRYFERVLALSEKGDGRKGAVKHCGVCNLGGHYASKCPAVARFRARQRRHSRDHEGDSETDEGGDSGNGGHDGAGGRSESNGEHYSEDDWEAGSKGDWEDYSGDDGEGGSEGDGAHDREGDGARDREGDGAHDREGDGAQEEGDGAHDREGDGAQEEGDGAQEEEDEEEEDGNAVLEEDGDENLPIEPAEQARVDLEEETDFLRSLCYVQRLLAEYVSRLEVSYDMEEEDEESEAVRGLEMLLWSQRTVNGMRNKLGVSLEIEDDFMAPDDLPREDMVFGADSVSDWPEEGTGITLC
jgi:hypothetical protein